VQFRPPVILSGESEVRAKGVEGSKVTLIINIRHLLNRSSMRERKLYYVYIMSSITGVLYVGISNSVDGRTLQHKDGDKRTAFTAKYNCTKLVYYEEFEYVNDAIAREKQLKGWSRKKKLALIREMNPLMTDLAWDWGKDYASNSDVDTQGVRGLRSFDSPPSTDQLLAQDDRVGNVVVN
jgi:putative endonuclease